MFLRSATPPQSTPTVLHISAIGPYSLSETVSADEYTKTCFDVSLVECIETAPVIKIVNAATKRWAFQN